MNQMTDKDYRLFFGILLIVIVLASYIALSEPPVYQPKAYMNDTVRFYDCMNCSKIVTLQNVYIDEYGLVRQLN